MRYDEGYGRGGRWRGRDLGPEDRGRPRGETGDDPVTRSFRGQPVHEVEHDDRHGRGGYGARGPARGGVDPRFNRFPMRGDTDFLGNPYGAAAFDDFPRGLYDYDHHMAEAEHRARYDREMRGYDRAMRGYDRGMRPEPAHRPEYWRMRQGLTGTGPRGHGGGGGYGQDYEAVRGRFGAGPVRGQPWDEPWDERGDRGWPDRDRAWDDRWRRRG